jgi:hypothetical protein
MDKRRIAAELHNLFGDDLDSRLSAAKVANNLCARSPLVNRASATEAAFARMWDYEASGLVENCPGPRGGAGWKLTSKGTALLMTRASTSHAG